MTNPPRPATIVLRVRRGPDNDVRTWARYEIESDGPLTVFAALRLVYESLDRTLAFRNYTCWKGLCRACEVTMDGRPVKGCLAVLEPGGEYRIEPREGVVVARDLLVPGRRTGEVCSP